ncbi:MAG: IS30 family transposase, partial [Actinomycetes bacterium]
RPKDDQRKLAGHTRLTSYIEARLDGTVRPDSPRARAWSPQQISHRLKVDFPDDESMQVSHETIYQALYVQGRGGLRKELHAALRTGRARRRPLAQTRANQQGRRMVAPEVLISERPAEVADRAVPGHWEGDLIIGTANKSAIGTLVERTTRFVMLLHLPNGYAADQVAAAMRTKITTLPAHLRRTLTWDQGREMTPNAPAGIDIGFTDPIDLYFCDPHSPWQRGTNENTNGLLRQYYPKGTDLSVHPASDLEDVAEALNTRPRQTLGWATPAEKLAELLSTS